MTPIDSTRRTLKQCDCVAGAKGTTSNAFAALHLQGGSSIQAKLVVGADGSSSRVRQMADLRTIAWDYNQRGLVATVATDMPNSTAWQVNTSSTTPALKSMSPLNKSLFGADRCQCAFAFLVHGCKRWDSTAGLMKLKHLLLKI